jgi:uncharacterized protein (TIGR02118 family)
MHKLVVLYPPPKDPDAFRSYYTETHIPLAAKLPGLRAYRYAFNVQCPAGDSPYFCVFEGEYDDAAAMAESMGSEHGAIVAADVPNYAPDGAVMIHYDVVDGS